MSTAASPGPNNILLLAVLGIGAYYLMTRRAMAGQVPVYAQRPPTTTTAERVSLVAAGANAIGGLLGRLTGGGGGSVPLLGTYDGRSQTPWDVTPQGPDGPRYNNPSAYVASDGLAANPLNASAFDYFDSNYAIA